MASVPVYVQHPESEDGAADPNILILWLDQYIGVPNDYLLLKRSFFMTIDPTTGYKVPLEQTGIDHSIRSQQGIKISIENVQFVLRAFDSIEKCFEAFEANLDKRIFIITSGTKGRLLIPILVHYFRDELLKHHSSYIFCSNMNMRRMGDVPTSNDWAFDFDDFLLMFNNEDLLLERMVLDAANYFFDRAKILQNDKDLRKARQNYRWSSRLLRRFDTMNKKNTNTKRHTEIEKILHEIDTELSANNDQDQFGEPPV